MSTHLRTIPVATALLVAAALLFSGCNAATSAIHPTPAQSGPAFVVGTDAPMASVVSFAVQLQSITATDAAGNSVSLISGSPSVDFARFNGLQTLLDLNDVAPGTYTSVTITLGPGTIGYLDTSTAQPTILTEAATFSTSTVTTTLATPMVVATASTPVGLHLDFDLRKSIQVDASGNITGAVTPTFHVNSVANSDSGAYIDTFDAAVVSVGATSFVVQGPHGRQFTVNVTGQTEWENNESLADLTTSSIVELSGQLDRADSTIDADCVAILSQNGFFAAGQVTYVTPATGDATSFDLYVRALLPTDTGITLGQIDTVDLNGNEKYFINWRRNAITQFLFNSSALLPGQHLSIGGPATGAANPDAVNAKRIVLRHWGFNGTVVPGSQDASNGTFQMQIKGFAGILVPQTVTVYTTAKSGFRDGPTGIGDLTDGETVRVVGLLLKDPLAANKTVLLAHYVDELK